MRRGMASSRRFIRSRHLRHGPVQFVDRSPDLRFRGDDNSHPFTQIAPQPFERIKVMWIRNCDSRDSLRFTDRDDAVHPRRGFRNDAAQTRARAMRFDPNRGCPVSELHENALPAVGVR